MADVLSYEEAASIVTLRAAALLPGPAETVALAAVSSRVLARSIRADDEQPAFPRSTRDGYACRAADAMTRGWLPVLGATHAGQSPPPPLAPHACWEIMTGAAVPAGADAVVMLEHIERAGDRIRLHPGRSLAAGDNIVARGEQAHAGEEMVPPGTLLNPAHIAVAAACGYAALDVYPRPSVALLTTGDELVSVDAAPAPGQIRNSNAPMLAALVAGAGGAPRPLPTARDTAEALDASLELALDADLLIVSGGVSAGTFDLVEPALARRGATFHFTGIRMQPGKPLVFGELARGAARQPLPFFGLPGNPISSAATFRLFAAPLLAALAGQSERGPRFLAAELARGTEGRGNKTLTRFFPSWCDFAVPAGRLPQVATVPWHGSGDLPAFARANCYLVVPEGVASLDAGAIVRILML